MPTSADNTLSWERVAGPKALTGVGRHAEPTYYRPSSARRFDNRAENPVHRVGADAHIGPEPDGR